MTLIDYTYFQNGVTVVPNLNQPPIVSNLEFYIGKYENVYLDKVLGLKLRIEFLEGLAEPVVEQRWTDLLNGKVYEVNGDTFEWTGFNNADKLSPIANYVVCKSTADGQLYEAGTGSNAPTNENSTVVPPHYRLGQNWTEMTEQNNKLIHFLHNNPVDYPNWKFEDEIFIQRQNVIGL